MSEINNNEAYWTKILFPFSVQAPNNAEGFYFNIDIKKKDANIFDLIKQIKQEVEMLLSPVEAYSVFSMVQKTEKINGDIAEVGVYKGGSAKLIYKAAINKPIHLFDTFEGLPELSEQDSPGQFHRGGYPASLEEVKNYLKDCSNIYFYKGFFPDTADSIKDKKFSFVHLDVDIYESTLSCLNFFYSRMSTGGVIISHDYTGSKGVREAFNKFFEDKPEILIEPLWTDQCFVIKI